MIFIMVHNLQSYVTIDLIISMNNNMFVRFEKSFDVETLTIQK